MKDFIVFGAPQIKKDEIDEVVNTLESTWLGTGPKVELFERNFAAYKGVSSGNVAAVSSCTAALHVSLIASGVKPGDEVITTAMTFCATINAIIHAGATPVLVDIDPKTLNIDPEKIESAITDRTKVILPVHFAGRLCDMEAVMKVAQRHSLKVVEDCAHAIEAEFRGRKSGTIGDFGCFSFYATKNMTTGEGGMVVASKQDDIDRVKTIALHGMTKDAWHRFGDKGYKHYAVVDCGFKYNMTDIEASIGLHQLNRIEKNWERRAEVWRVYDRAFESLPVALPHPVRSGDKHAYHLYTIEVDYDRCGLERDEFLSFMTDNKVGVGVHYLSIPEHPYYQNTYGWSPARWPAAMKFGRRTVSLPLSAKLKDSEVSRVVDTVIAALK